MTVRVYRWDDASAPVLNSLTTGLLPILKACLVTGYGSKAAAGWSNPYSAANVEAFVNSTTGGSGYGIKVSNATGIQYARIEGFKTIDGSGVTTEPFPTTAQVSGGLYTAFTISSNDSSARPWMVVADQHRFYLWVGYNVYVGDGFASTTYEPMFFAGDILAANPTDPYRFMVIGGISGSASSDYFGGYYSTVSTTATSGHYLARNFSGATISKAAGKVAGCYVSSASIGAAGTAYPDPVTGGMLLSEVVVHDADSNNRIRGRMPGLYNPIHSLPGNPGDTFTGVGALAGKTFILLDASNNGTRCRIALEISDTWS